MPGTLYVVATPLGNLEDITQRALRVLREVSLIAAEDTRHSGKLLAHFGIRTSMISYHDHVERERAPWLVERLRGGESVALISDAGTPCIADPGYRLVRAAVAAGITVVPVPGPSAVMAALCAAGLPTDRFAFEGFVPARAVARRRFWEEHARERRTLVCFETARRLEASLRDLAAIEGEREVVVSRELSKLHESFLRGPVVDVLAALPGQVLRGEITLLVAPASSAEPEHEEIRERLRELRGVGLTLRDAARDVAQELGASRRRVYQIGLQDEREPRSRAPGTKGSGAEAQRGG